MLSTFSFSRVSLVVKSGLVDDCYNPVLMLNRRLLSALDQEIYMSSYEISNIWWIYRAMIWQTLRYLSMIPPRNIFEILLNLLHLNKHNNINFFLRNSPHTIDTGTPIEPRFWYEKFHHLRKQIVFQHTSLQVTIERC